MCGVGGYSDNTVAGLLPLLQEKESTLSPTPVSPLSGIATGSKCGVIGVQSCSKELACLCRVTKS